jgi:hypothetical protein
MFEGKIFFGVTGTPMRKIALVKSAFAEAEPVPFTFANLTTKSFILISGAVPFEPGDIWSLIFVFLDTTEVTH